MDRLTKKTFKKNLQDGDYKKDAKNLFALQASMQCNTKSIKFKSR